MASTGLNFANPSPYWLIDTHSRGDKYRGQSSSCQRLTTHLLHLHKASHWISQSKGAALTRNQSNKSKQIPSRNRTWIRLDVMWKQKNDRNGRKDNSFTTGSFCFRSDIRKQGEGGVLQQSLDSSVSEQQPGLTCFTCWTLQRMKDVFGERGKSNNQPSELWHVK